MGPFSASRAPLSRPYKCAVDTAPRPIYALATVGTIKLKSPVVARCRADQDSPGGSGRIGPLFRPSSTTGVARDTSV